MVSSQNGWAAGPSKAAAQIVDARVGEITFPGGLKSGDAATVLLWVATQMHLRVEAGVPGWCWGWNWRAVRGASSLSNHASGTAFDWNAPRHPLAKRNTWTPVQRAELLRIGAEVDNVVRFGFTYVSRADDMHVELVGAPVAVARVAARIRTQAQAVAVGGAPAPVVKTNPAAEVAVVGGANGDGLLRPGAKGAEVVGWQGELWRIGYGCGPHDGVFGPAVEGCTLDLQRASGPGTADDGLVGNQTRDVARAVPTYPKAPGPDLPLCGPGGPEATVGAFQQRLRDRGWTITVDRRYGQQTADVLTRFQRDALSRGFEIGRPDGYGGPATWTALHLAPITR
jgi:peptidoglycan hydrolase-like protein with peptidoglycan-binding domain